MQLRRVELRNIRSYDSAALEFAPGTTLIVGDVGAGKTSLLYAIEMALFGAAEVDAAYLVRHGSARAEVSVQLEAEGHRFDLVRRFRRIRRKGRETFEAESLTFREDDRAASYSATEVRQRVIDLLGFPDNPNPQAHSDLWRWAIYVPQEQMRAILTARPQERLETVRKALGVERYRLAAENAQELDADLRAIARHRRDEAARLGHFDAELERATAAAAERELEHATFDRSIGPLETDVETHRQRLSAEEAELRRLEADRREAESLRREQETDAAALDSARAEQVARAREIERRRSDALALRDAADRVPALERARQDAEAAASRARARRDQDEDGVRALAAARSQCAAAERHRQEIEGQLHRAEEATAAARASHDRAVREGPVHEPAAPTPRTLPEIASAITAARLEEQEQVGRAARARAAVAEIDELLGGGVCPRCGQTVDADRFGPHRVEAADELASADAARQAMAGRVAHLEDERGARERFERAHERWIESDRRRTELADAAARAETEAASLTASVADSKRAEQSARTAVESLRSVEAAAAEHRSEAEAAEQELRRAEEALRAGSVAAEKARGLRESAEALAAEAERAGRTTATLEHRITARAGRLEVLRRATADGTTVASRAQTARAALTAAERALSDARSSLAGTAARLEHERRLVEIASRGRSERLALETEAAGIDAKAAWVKGPLRLHLLAMERELLAHAQAAFDRAFGRYFASLVDDPSLLARVDAGFTPEVLIDGAPTPAEALSGGERTALALAFRLALSGVVRALGGVRLETLLLDEPTDGFSSEQVTRMGELFGELALPQVIVVSHESGLAGIADRTVRVRKVDGRATLEGDGVGTPAEGPLEAAAGGSVRRRTAARDDDAVS